MVLLVIPAVSTAAMGMIDHDKYLIGLCLLGVDFELVVMIYVAMRKAY